MARVAVATAVLIAVVLGLAVEAVAQDEEPSQDTGVFGTPLLFEDEPVVGVTIEVTDTDGNVVGTAETDAEGRWEVGLPGPGTYTVTLVVDTLPEGVPGPDRESTELDVTTGRRRPINFNLDGSGSAASTVDRPSTPERVAQATFNGVKQGLIIAMAAVGLSLIFGTTGLINFAHGEAVTFGAVVTWSLHVQAGLPLVLAALIALAIAGAVGGALETGIFRPLRARKLGPFQLMVLTIGLGLVARQLIFVFFGGDGKFFEDFNIQSGVDFGPFSSTPRDLIIMALSASALIAVALVLSRTRVGKATRAVSDNPDLSESSGIDVNRIIVFVWISGAALAALGGVFLGAVVNVDFLMGFNLLLMMFAAVILGGLGTAYGAMLGGLIIGVATEIPTVWFQPEIKAVFALLVLIGVLLIRPQGLLGSKARVG